VRTTSGHDNGGDKRKGEWEEARLKSRKWLVTKKDMGENRKNTAYNLQIYIEIVDSQKVKFVNCKPMTWERIVSYSLHITIYKFVNIVDSLLARVLLVRWLGA